MATLTFRAPEAVSLKIRAAARRRGVPVSRFIKEAAEREAMQESTALIMEEPNETTAAAIREPIESLPRYRRLDDALRSLKSDAKRRSKKPVSA